MLQIVPDSEITVGDTIEFTYNNERATSIITNSSVDNHLIVWIPTARMGLIDISIDNVSDIKRLKKGPWHDIICPPTELTLPIDYSIRTSVDI